MRRRFGSFPWSTLSSLIFVLYVFFMLFLMFGQIQLTHLWFDRYLSCLSMNWILTLYLPEVWMKFKLPTCGLKSNDASIPLDSFWSCIFFFFFCVFVFLKERDIKVEQNYIFSHVFNKDGLQNSKWANFRWVKCQNSNYR